MRCFASIWLGLWSSWISGRFWASWVTSWVTSCPFATLERPRMNSVGSPVSPELQDFLRGIGGTSSTRHRLPSRDCLGPTTQRKGVSSSFVHSAIAWLSYRFVIDILRILPIDSKNLAVKTSDLQNDTCYISSSRGRTSRKVFFTEKCRITCSIISTAGHSRARFDLQNG